MLMKFLKKHFEIVKLGRSVQFEMKFENIL